MSYELEFDPRALKEWQKLGETVKNQFRKKLAEVLSHPRIPSARLHDFPDCFKIKLKASGVWLQAGLSGEGRTGSGTDDRYW